jgi:hypothetical protein
VRTVEHDNGQRYRIVDGRLPLRLADGGAELKPLEEFSMLKVEMVREGMGKVLYFIFL